MSDLSPKPALRIYSGPVVQDTERTRRHQEEVRDGLNDELRQLVCPQDIGLHPDPEKIRELLLEDGVDPNTRMDSPGNFPVLHQAVHDGRDGVIEVLLEGGADPNLLTGDGRTALDLVMSKTKYTEFNERAKLLKRHGAKTSDDLRAELHRKAA